MNEHAGAACALSVLIVGVFAVLLHDKAPPATPPRPAAPGIARDVPPSRPVEPPRPAAPVPPPPQAPTAEIKRSEPPPPRPTGPEPKAVVAVSTRASKRPKVLAPRSSATVVEAGETLADVAARVYGSADAVQALWKANRDQLARPDSPLARGALLRTP